MTSTLTLTPCRSLHFNDEEVTSILTPEVKRNLCQLFDDEDSGLGMDDNANPSADVKVTTRLDFGNVFASPSPNTRSANHVGVKRSIFSGKRHRDDDSAAPSPKRRTMLYEEGQVSPADVKDAVNRLVEEEDLIGDGTDTFCLPTIRGKHQDLKSISADTMTDLLTGAYDDAISSYRIVDCRYPYEFEGGHIKDAENRYTRDQVKQLLHDTHVRDVTGKRDIIIFHCEFSSERGPRMMRFLRTQDRAQNEASYPTLTFPEIYLLDGGYKKFYHTDKTLCQPMEYKPMIHPGHCGDLRHFRSRSKSWAVGERKRALSRRP
ncbi:M-phase inducer phosphatase-like [Argopecten irradians]|uniref:M-phase inducer phosphatase-like n=1 Tax=Argopecten irradians TaxID=31199 RepID=UPI0037230B99